MVPELLIVSGDFSGRGAVHSSYIYIYELLR